MGNIKRVLWSWLWKARRSGADRWFCSGIWECWYTTVRSSNWLPFCQWSRTSCDMFLNWKSSFEQEKMMKSVRKRLQSFSGHLLVTWIVPVLPEVIVSEDWHKEFCQVYWTGSPKEFPAGSWKVFLVVWWVDLEFGSQGYDLMSDLGFSDLVSKQIPSMLCCWQMIPQSINSWSDLPRCFWSFISFTMIAFVSALCASFWHPFIGSGWVRGLRDPRIRDKRTRGWTGGVGMWGEESVSSCGRQNLYSGSFYPRDIG